MPPRSPWMKRRIFGFQRRVWWPKWTPASSSSRMPTSGMVLLPWFVVRCGTAARTAERGPGERSALGRAGPRSGRSVRRVDGVSVTRISVRKSADGASLRQARSSAARSAGAAVTSTGSPRDRVREGQARGVQELAPQPEQRPASPYSGSPRDRVADRLQVDADLVRAPGLEAHAQQRRVGQRLLDLEVGDRLARLVGVGREPRAVRGGRGRSARRSCRCAPAGGPRRARGTRA